MYSGPTVTETNGTLTAMSNIEARGYWRAISGFKATILQHDQENSQI